jgi:hypothetical protein
MGLWGFINGCSRVHVHKKIMVYKVARFWKQIIMHKGKTKHQIGASTIIYFVEADVMTHSQLLEGLKCESK